MFTNDDDANNIKTLRFLLGNLESKFQILNSIVKKKDESKTIESTCMRIYNKIMKMFLFVTTLCLIVFCYYFYVYVCIINKLM